MLFTYSEGWNLIATTPPVIPVKTGILKSYAIKYLRFPIESGMTRGKRRKGKRGKEKREKRKEKREKRKEKREKGKEKREKRKGEIEK
ncbi:MAG: hypothetical protein SNI54_01830 [Rikenellaceae bacterium]